MKGRQEGMFKLEGRVIGFGKKEFKSGQNFTVRLGADWADKRDIRLNDYVSVVSQDHDEFFFQAKITHVMKCSLADIPASIVKANHQADMRDGIGLVLGLQEYYKKTLVRTDLVICVGFEAVVLEAKSPKVREPGPAKIIPPSMTPTNAEDVYDNG